ncbi:MAG: hypothetical protein PHZ06_11605 [Proteiniphilum sp.]|nr:hypothetical protein [Proteiniphilum sp.]MDD4453467.1 hypothetical protein [Proteiniphilum sp.]
MSAKKQIAVTEDKNLVAAFYTKTDDLKQKNASDLTVAEKLMLKARDKTRVVTIDDVELEVRVLPQIARTEIVKTFESGDPDAIITAIADNFVDESINKEFLESGFFTKSQMQEMLYAIIESSKAEIDQIIEFRKTHDRTKSV